MPPSSLNNQAHSPEINYAVHPYRWAVLAGVWLAYACFGMTVGSLAPLVRPITLDLGISHSALGTILGAWPLAYIAAAAACGALTDRMGPRRTLVFALLIIAVSGALRGLADGYLGMFLGVAVFGLGGPLVSIGAPKLVSLWFVGKERIPRFDDLAVQRKHDRMCGAHQPVENSREVLPHLLGAFEKRVLVSVILCRGLSREAVKFFPDDNCSMTSGSEVLGQFGCEC